MREGMLFSKQILTHSLVYREHSRYTSMAVVGVDAQVEPIHEGVSTSLV
jgi:hypothetical protein